MGKATLVKDIPSEILKKNIKFVSIDTEAMGLNHNRDRLCTLQIGIDDESFFVIHFPDRSSYKAPNLIKILKNRKIEKLFHYARFDVTMIYKYLGVLTENIICTRILSKITRTYTQRHGLKELCYHFCKVELSKGEQSSDWGSKKLSEHQLRYAEKDVLYLHKIYQKLKEMAIREGRYHVAEAAFRIIPQVALIEKDFFNPIELIEH